MTHSEISIIRFTEDVGSLLNRSAGLGEAPFIDGKLVPARIDRFAQPLHTEIAQLFSDRIQSFSDVVELSRHRHLRCAPLAAASDSSSPQ